MNKTVIRVPELQGWLDQAKVPLSLAVRHASVLYVSGVPPILPNSMELCPGGIAEQTTQVLENIKLILQAAGTSLPNVLKCTIFAVNAGHFAAINDVYRRYFPVNPPARTFCTVGSWPAPFDVEIECVASC